ncbi:MAG: ABC transporter ATP-binding protein [Crenarchaeota archaeon]|nr:ABC transporter ATP-binding protein [Thermoproteota archaeon]
MLKIRNLLKEYENGENPLIVLNDISLDIDDGEFVVVLGPSGSGKSTLLNAISGLTDVKSGQIEYDGIDITKLSESELTSFRRGYTSFVFQSYYLMPVLSVKQNIKMGANLTHNKNVEDIIDNVGLRGKENRLPSELSGGERQRVSIARAIAKKPKVMFCDEPTGALDEATGRMILKFLIANQKKEGYTMIMVTHNENIAELSNKIIRMNSGKITGVFDNSPKTVDEIRW